MILLMPLPATCNVFEINAASARGASPTYRRSGCALYKSTPAEYLLPDSFLLLYSRRNGTRWRRRRRREGRVRLLGVRRSRGGRGGRGRSRLSLLLTFHAFYTVVSSVVFDKRELKIKGVSIGKDASHGAYDNSFS